MPIGVVRLAPLPIDRMIWMAGITGEKLANQDTIPGTPEVRPAAAAKIARPRKVIRPQPEKAATAAWFTATKHNPISSSAASKPATKPADSPNSAADSTVRATAWTLIRAAPGIRGAKAICQVGLELVTTRDGIARMTI